MREGADGLTAVVERHVFYGYAVILAVMVLDMTTAPGHSTGLRTASPSLLLYSQIPWCKYFRSTLLARQNQPKLNRHTMIRSTLPSHPPLLIELPGEVRSRL
jgi:hypothetical protein